MKNKKTIHLKIETIISEGSQLGDKQITDDSGKVYGHLLRNANGKGYKTILNFDYNKDFDPDVGSLYRGFMIVANAVQDFFSVEVKY